MEDKISNAAETVGEVSFKFKLINKKALTNALIVILALVLYYFLVPKWDFIVYNTMPAQQGMPLQQGMSGSIAPIVPAGTGVAKINKISGKVYGWAGDAGWKLLEKNKYPKE